MNVRVANFDLAVVHKVKEVDHIVEGHVPQDDDGVGGRIGTKKATKEQGAGGQDLWKNSRLIRLI